MQKEELVKVSSEDFSKFQEERRAQDIEAVEGESSEEASKLISVPAILFLREIDDRVRERELGQDHI